MWIVLQIMLMAMMLGTVGYMSVLFVKETDFSRISRMLKKSRKEKVNRHGK